MSSDGKPRLGPSKDLATSSLKSSLRQSIRASKSLSGGRPVDTDNAMSVSDSPPPHLMMAMMTRKKIILNLKKTPS
ncbi:hypothetical protein Plhal304r1_c003g0010451 [Plasmopara halstedii]